MPLSRTYIGRAAGGKRTRRATIYIVVSLPGSFSGASFPPTGVQVLGADRAHGLLSIDLVRPQSDRS